MVREPVFLDGTSTTMRIATFPSADGAFAAFVRTSFDRLSPGERSPEALQRALRKWHSRAVVQPQDSLARIGDETWYAYRDGHPGVRVEDGWWESPGVAHVTYDSNGIFTGANEAACALVELHADCLVGRHWSDLVPATARDDDAAWLWQQIAAQGWAQSVFDFPLPDGGVRVIEYRTSATSQPGRYESWWRVLTVFEAAESVCPAAVGRRTGTPVQAS